MRKESQLQREVDERTCTDARGDGVGGYRQRRRVWDESRKEKHEGVTFKWTTRWGRRNGRRRSDLRHGDGGSVRRRRRRIGSRRRRSRSSGGRRRRPLRAHSAFERKRRRPRSGTVTTVRNDSTGEEEGEEEGEGDPGDPGEGLNGAGEGTDREGAEVAGAETAGGERSGTTYCVGKRGRKNDSEGGGSKVEVSCAEQIGVKKEGQTEVEKPQNADDSEFDGEATEDRRRLATVEEEDAETT